DIDECDFPAIYGCYDVNKCNITGVTCDLPIITECENNQGSYECSCRDGFTNLTTGTNGSVPYRCEDINECASDIHNCNLTVSTCVDVLGSFDCICRLGYQKDNSSTVCVDIDECKNSFGATPMCNTTSSFCVNTIGSYHCDCNA
ncbi:unnamed protein product, partial [Owenia fusiformis]